MDRKIYTIGSRALGNEIVLPEANIMIMHARIVVQSNGIQYIEKRDNQAQINVNGLMVKRKVFVPSDKIFLAQSLFSITRFFKTSNGVITGLRKLNDFSEEFMELKEVYSGYIEARAKIQKQAQRKDLLLDPLMMIPFAGLVLRKLVSVEAGNKNKINMNEALAKLKHEFQKVYRCPNPDCSKSLGETPWSTLADQRQCSSCQVNWVA